MSNSGFTSGLSNDLQQFLEYKRCYNHPYKNGKYYLLDFDRFCTSKYSDRATLDKDMVLEWACIRKNENSNGFISRITPIRQLGIYLTQHGKDAFILPLGFKGNQTIDFPHIFSRDDLYSFFDAADHMDYYYQSMVRHIVAPVLFRFMYSCGLRPMEARKLCKSDINFRTGRIFIRESKGHKERIIVAPADLMEIVKNYTRRTERIYPDSDALFLDSKGRPLTYYNQQYLFEHCLDISNLRKSGATLYSFRHTFATYRIYQWIRDGKDINNLLPRLSAYMGHNNVKNTLYYFHLVPEIFTNLTGYDWNGFSSLIPEVKSYE